ncbi:efflux transporter periplasmic adaptor subunit [Sulfitobacter sp. EhC04]|uniref:efflux RND transporter periplasmic adaptor subunit n=1 Tax=Sulfitobacter sp. EhC04 TaxID=1849168 RepID=UPI0007F3440E|nr:efflux RND transporter periplasmic adaptor subunit [Sulfitobacter sp. EhC04]OAN70955.1 efflux transporter periplasmic adaptor subunit [Sulfitobacter sp. EhC04]
MKALLQTILFLLVLCAGLYVWIIYVPAARPLIERSGIPDLLGIQLSQAEAAPQQATPRGGGGPAKVAIAAVGETAIADRITAIGDGRAKRSVTVRSNAVGVITELTLSAGVAVEAGTVIARLLDEEEEIALEQAQINLDEAQREETRIKQLSSTGAVTEVRLRATEVALRSAELAVRKAQFDLSQRQITAPISGRVGITDVEVGDRVNAQDVLATITDRSDILIDFRVPERVVGKIRPGQQITVTPLGLRDTVLTGEVAAIDTVVDRTSRTLLVQGRVANSNDRLRAGMAFSVAMTFPGDSYLSIPPLALQWSSEGPYVWAVRDGKSVQVAVTIAQRNSDSVLIRADALNAGENVVTEGVQTLRNGAEVSPVNNPATTDGQTGKETL